MTFSNLNYIFGSLGFSVSLYGGEANFPRVRVRVKTISGHDTVVINFSKLTMWS